MIRMERIMSKLFIYEPAMCCETGLCGVSVDPELLRISTVINTLKTSGIDAVRYNLTSTPREFVSNKEINLVLNQEGIAVLPITVVDGLIVKKGSYPTNDELVSWLGLQQDLLALDSNDTKEDCGCGSDVSCCSGDSCCGEEVDCCGETKEASEVSCCGGDSCCGGEEEDCCGETKEASELSCCEDEKCSCNSECV
jgi:hypothetical protein